MIVWDENTLKCAQVVACTFGCGDVFGWNWTLLLQVKKRSHLSLTMSEDRLEALILVQAHIDYLPSINEIVDCFSISVER